MAGSANILRRLSEPNRTPRLLHDALVNQLVRDRPQRAVKTNGCSRPQPSHRAGVPGDPASCANPVGRPLISTRTRVKSAAVPVSLRCARAAAAELPLPVGRATMSDSRRAGTARSRWFDRSLSGTPHAWESPKALRAVIHGYAPRKKEPLPSWQGNSHSWGGGRR